MARIEEYVLRKSMGEHLPAPPACIADIGGGNGRHAFYMAQLGYQVWLCDITRELVEDAARRNKDASPPLVRVELADARSLTWPDEYADAAMLLGPMYCLADRRDRNAVLRETLRVLKPGAPLLVQFFSRVAALRSLLEVAPATAGIFDWRSFLHDGVFADKRIPDFLRVHYFSTPAEALEELRSAGLRVREIRGMDGPAPSFGQRNLADAPDEIIAQWGEIACTLGEIPDYRCASTHLLAVAHKPVAGGAR